MNSSDHDPWLGLTPPAIAVKPHPGRARWPVSIFAGCSAIIALLMAISGLSLIGTVSTLLIAAGMLVWCVAALRRSRYTLILAVLALAIPFAWGVYLVALGSFFGVIYSLIVVIAGLYQWTRRREFDR